jgi:hypothetical protein
VAAMRSPMDRGGAAYLDPLPATQSGAEQPVLVPLRALPATPGCEEAGQGIADTYRLINSETFGAGRTLKVVWPTKTWSASDPAPSASHVQILSIKRRWPARVEMAPAKAVLLSFGRRDRAHGHPFAQGCGVATTRTTRKEGLGGTEEGPKARSGVPDGSHKAVSGGTSALADVDYRVQLEADPEGLPFAQCLPVWPTVRAHEPGCAKRPPTSDAVAGLTKYNATIINSFSIIIGHKGGYVGPNTLGRKASCFLAHPDAFAIPY